MPAPLAGHAWDGNRSRALGLGAKMLQNNHMTLAKPTFPAPDHDHGRCTADAIAHAEQVCAKRAQKFTPIRRQVLAALLSSHRPLGAYEVIDELAKSMPRPAPPALHQNFPSSRLPAPARIVRKLFKSGMILIRKPEGHFSGSCQ